MRLQYLLLLLNRTPGSEEGLAVALQLAQERFAEFAHANMEEVSHACVKDERVGWGRTCLVVAPCTCGKRQLLKMCLCDCDSMRRWFLGEQVQSLMGCLLFADRLDRSPYSALLSEDLWHEAVR